MINDMAKKVDEFQKMLEIPYHEFLLPPDRMRFRVHHLKEEIEEAEAAYAAGDGHEVVDGLVDLIYVAIGMLLEMGVPPDAAFDTVHEANMKKKLGATKRGEAKDAVKPDGWTPPDHRPLLDRMSALNKVSPVFVRLTALREQRGRDYNRGTVKRVDHFPLGHLSYFQMVWVKTIRLRSMVESNDGNDELISRELDDLIAYACFWSEWIGGIDMER